MLGHKVVLLNTCLPFLRALLSRKKIEKKFGNFGNIRKKEFEKKKRIRKKKKKKKKQLKDEYADLHINITYSR